MSRRRRQANLPPRGGDVRQDRGGRCPAGLSIDCNCALELVPVDRRTTKVSVPSRPPSALPGISPTRGEIDRFGVLRTLHNKKAARSPGRL
ncbi:MAG: hypothetical protein EOS55_02835 [Mesorhizobium sp.]|nr:MAG: hypothetical protein EOS55_02835 [Mesorhizobium sp.]